MAMIETHDLRRTFKTRGKADDVEAVRGVDLTVDAGEIFGFLGPNGAGKTTTLRMLATLLHADVRDRDRRGRRPGPRARRRSAAASGTCRRAARPTRPRPAAGSWSSRARLYGIDKATRRAPRGGGPRRPRPRGRRGPADRARTPGGCGAGSMSGSASSIARRSSSSTNRRPASTRRRGPGCGTRSARFARRARPSS